MSPSTEPRREVTDDEVRTFQLEGVVLLRGLFDREWVTLLQDEAERGLARPTRFGEELAQARGDRGRFFHDTFMWRHSSACRKFVFDSPAACVAAKVLGAAKVHIFFDQWLIKEPGTPTRTPWHNDQPYWPIRGNLVASLWLALDSVTSDSGAVEYVKGSHLWGKRFKPATFSGDHQYTEPLPPVPDIDSRRHEFDIVRYEMEPGDCTLHHGLLVHGAPGNLRDDRRRRAFVTRWAGEDVTYAPRKGLQDMPEDPGIPPGAPLSGPLWPQIWP